MDVKDLRIFARVATGQSLSSVAASLGVSPGTISKRIQALEADLDVRLLDRTTRSSRLTEEGRLFLPHAERVLLEIDHAKDAISANAGHPAGHLRVSAPAILRRKVIRPALQGFLEAYPGIEVCVDITDRIANLHEEGYDVSIRSGALPDSNLKAKRLAADRMLLVAAPAYVARHGAPQRPDDLERHVCLVHGEQRTWTLVRGKDSLSHRVAGRIGSDSGELLHELALDGAGLLRTSEIAVAEDLAAGRLLRMLPDYELASDTALWAVYPNAKHAMPRLRAFIDHLVEFCRTRLDAKGLLLPDRTAVQHSNATADPMAVEPPPARARSQRR